MKEREVTETESLEYNHIVSAEIRARPKRSYFYTQNQGEINMGAVLAFVAGSIIGIGIMCLLQINR